jgi:hypothetical protein
VREEAQHRDCVVSDGNKWCAAVSTIPQAKYLRQRRAIIV